ncbi:putative YccA/Bax inhibitor family protein [Natronobacillus azotifigens]|uniref:Heme ABC transporter n=1 Tax=Natronobacillus azotifigens TaxID=472978 RepID=A0A9J6RFJ9_9BACI|nr:hypothetical protein [Natronobacillus azotifigens]MCZ0704384.1 hypothetical protein [Natronobacillus azotifigens]
MKGTKTPDSLHKKEQGENIEVWADVVKIKDLMLAMVITTVVALVAYFIAPSEAPMPLIFGLVGALIGFIISSILIQPKRQFKEIEREEG